ncbi:GtrA family protein [Sphingomonas abietis]|uniref:GtrA family protein n=1 Tax=Sphingomonas abietis TaxID=3012344 RepID=A0ABY7NRW2_9SPHN|nr:GtrA family protein [Sphingomonas abietis]WBO22694.1 GtrA family protein [Sphingomonas abietis]
MRDGLVRLWTGLDHGHRALVVQLLRYGVVGVGVTLFQIVIYNVLIGAGHRPPLIANTLATMAAMVVGYTIHSRFTFDGHGERESEIKAIFRFVVTNGVVGFGVNSFWVWLFTQALHLSPHWPSVPMFCVTPAILFWLNRKWVFD